MAREKSPSQIAQEARNRVSLETARTETSDEEEEGEDDDPKSRTGDAGDDPMSTEDEGDDDPEEDDDSAKNLSVPRKDHDKVTARAFTELLSDCTTIGERALILVYKNVIGLTYKQVKHLRHACILTPEDLMEQAKDSLVRHCDAKNGIIPVGRQQRLLALKYWMLTKVLSRETLNVSEFTDDVRQEEQLKLARDELMSLKGSRVAAPDHKDGNAVRRNAIYPKHFGGDRKDFPTWRIQFEGYIGSNSLKYVIDHSYKAYGFIPTMDEAVYVDSHEPSEEVKTSSAYTQDNNFVYQQLKSLCASGNAYQLIRQFEDSCDGRQAWITLCRFYESAGVTSSAKIDAHNTIMNSKYDGESRRKTYTDYVSGYIGAAVTLERLGEPVAEAFYKQQFVNNITCSQLKVQVEMARTMLATQTFTQLQLYFASQIALKRIEEKQSSGRSANYAAGKDKKRSGKPSGKRKANKAHRDDKPKGRYDSKKSGTQKSGHISVPPDIWKTLDEKVKQGIIASNQSVRNAKAASTTDSSSTNDDSEMVNNYTAPSTTARTGCLVGSKIAKRSSEKHIEISGTPSTGVYAVSSTTDEGVQHLKSVMKPTLKNSKIKSTDASILKAAKGADGAGLMFGRAAICRHANMISSWSEMRSCDGPTRIAPTAFARASRTRKSRNSGHCIIDSGADTVCVGDGFAILSRTGRRVTLKGFDDGKTLTKEVEVVTAATAWEDNDGEIFILVFHEALDLGRDQRTSLLCPNQIRFAGHQIDDIPRFLTQGRSIHGIKTCDEMYMPFDLTGHTSYLGTRTPTADELNSCEHVILTGDAPWDPEEGDWEELEKKYSRKDRYCVSEDLYGRHANIAEVIPHTSTERLANPAFSGKRKLDISTDDIRRRFGNVPREVIEETIAHTTQLAERCGEMPLTRRYKTKFAQLRYRRLKTTLYSDTFASNVKSTRGNIKTQGFVNGDSFFVYHFPMTSEKEAHLGLVAYMHDVGIPAKIHTDNAKAETLGDWKKTIREYHIKQTTTEPYSPWQNKAEREFGKVRTLTRNFMDTHKVPSRLWDYAQEHAVEIHNHTSRKTLNWLTPLECETGDTPDCSHLLYFDFYEPVWYWDNPEAKFPTQKRKLGRWLGVARNVGQALCFYILVHNGEVITRSTVKAVTEQDGSNMSHDIATFDTEVRGNFAEDDVLQISSAIERAKIAREFATDAEVQRNRHVLYEMYTEDDVEIETGLTVDDYIEETQSGQIIGVTVLVERAGKAEQAIVKSRKRDSDGKIVLENSGDDEYIVEFADGAQETHQYSTLIDAVYSQYDENGDEWYTFKDIIAHEKRARGGRGRTRGWFLQVEWLNGEVTWEPLTSLKDSNPYEVAKYAKTNDLLKEKAFSYWARHVLKKRDSYIRAARRRKLNNTFKYGVEVPRNVAHALELDRKNGNTYWRDAISKEMGSLNLHKVFKILERGEPMPDGYQMIPMWIIFDVKMNLTRKARLVAGGHVTKAPAWDCYCSVASRQSVRLAFLVAALNELGLVMIDVGNAFINALSRESVCARAGPEFGEFEGCIVIIVKALYGLRSSGSAWHAQFSDHLKSMGFTQSRADMDMWLRRQRKPDGSEYYEYLVVYVDDVLIVSHNTQAIVDAIAAHPYELKGGDAPETYLGATIGRFIIPGSNESTWCMSSTQYLERAISTVESRMGKLPGGKPTTPLPTDYHPEIDSSPELKDEDANYYLSLIGILQWLCELGRVDICFAVALMSRFNAIPRQGHMDTLLRIFAYLKAHDKSKLVFDYDRREFPESKFQTYDWTEMYQDAQEEIPDGVPEPLGKPVQITVFADAAHADDLVTRRSTSGIIIFVNGTPIRWYSKRQNTVEGSTYGSEFIAMRIATEMIIALRTDLRMLGVPLDGPATLFCDNQSVVINSSVPTSMLKKKHNSISYHKVRENIAAGTMRVAKEPTETNLADILTKPLAGPRFKDLIRHILW